MSGFEVPGLRVRLRVFVSGRESLLVLCQVQMCGVALSERWPKGRCSLCDVLCEVHGLRIKRGYVLIDDVYCQQSLVESL